MILNIQYSVYAKIYTLAMKNLNLNLFQDSNDYNDIV